MSKTEIAIGVYVIILKDGTTHKAYWDGEVFVGRGQRLLPNELKGWYME